MDQDSPHHYSWGKQGWSPFKKRCLFPSGHENRVCITPCQCAHRTFVKVWRNKNYCSDPFLLRTAKCNLILWSKGSPHFLQLWMHHQQLLLDLGLISRAVQLGPMRISQVLEGLQSQDKQLAADLYMLLWWVKALHSYVWCSVNDLKVFGTVQYLPM